MTPPSTSASGGSQLRYDEALVAAVRAFLRAEERPALIDAVFDVDDTAALVDRAVAHGVAPLLADVLVRGGIELPGPGGAALREEVGRETLQTMLGQAYLTRCVGAMNDQGIEPILLKGAALSSALYPDPALRPSCDIDLLVTQAEWPRVRAALLETGAHSVGRDLAELPATLDATETFDHWLLFKAPNGLAVDCTFDPLELGVRANCLDDCRQTARALPVGSGKALRLSPEYELMALCVHLNRHGYRRLIWWTDIALLLQAEGERLDWVSLARACRREGVSVSVAETLHAVNDVLGAPVSEAQLSLLRAGRMGTAVWNRFWPREDIQTFDGLHEGPLVFRKSRSGLPSRRFIAWNLANVALTGRAVPKSLYFGRLALPSRSFLLARGHGEQDDSYARLWSRRLRSRMLRPDATRQAAGERPGMSSELSGKMLRGVGWGGTSQLFTRALQFVVTAMLARLLTPNDFGLVGMAAMVTMLVSMFAEFGLGTALVQKKDLHDADVSTALWTSVGLGLALFGMCYAGAPLVAQLFHSPPVTAILRVASLGFVMGSFGIAPLAMLNRRMDFKGVAIAEVISSVAYGVVALSMAIAGFGVWSMVAAGLVMAGAKTISAFARARPRIRFEMARSSLQALVPFGMRVFGSNMISYARYNLDYLIVGSTLGATPLGLYTLAFRIADFPRHRLASTVAQVALPAMSSAAENEESVKHTYKASLVGISVLSFPLLVGIASVAPEFVDVVYGPKWHEVVVPLQILLTMGMLLPVCDPGVSLLYAKGRPGWMMRLSVLYLVSVAVFVGIGLRWGIVGVAGGVSVATVMYFVAMQAALRRLLGVGLVQTMRSVSAPAAASAAMALALVAYRGAAHGLGLETGVLWLVGSVFLGGAVYTAVLTILKPHQAKAVIVRVMRARDKGPAVKSEVTV